MKKELFIGFLGIALMLSGCVQPLPPPPSPPLESICPVLNIPTSATEIERFTVNDNSNASNSFDPLMQGIYACNEEFKRRNPNFNETPYCYLSNVSIGIEQFTTLPDGFVGVSATYSCFCFK